MDQQEAAADVNAVSANTDAAAPAVAEPTVQPDAEPVVEPVAEPAAEAAAEAADSGEENAKEEYHERVRKPVEQSMLERTQRDLMKMLDFLGFDDAIVKASEERGDILLSVESQDAGRIIGRKGQTMESIQLLLNRMVQKDDPEYPRILISIDGYASRFANGRGHSSRTTPEDGEQTPRRERHERHERREHREDRPRRERGPRRERRSRDDEGAGSQHEENLRQQALDAAKEVRHWGDPKTLPAMNAHDRRIIHITLENEPDLQTESLGEGAKKEVVISLKK